MSRAGGFGTPREQAGSLTMLRPESAVASVEKNAENEVRQCGGNVVLLEARLCEMTSSIRALARSNVDLEAALKDSPEDPDFLQALSENRLAIRRQGLVAQALVREMNAMGTKVDLEEDIRDAVSNVEGSANQQGEGVSPGTANGLYL